MDYNISKDLSIQLFLIRLKKGLTEDTSRFQFVDRAKNLDFLLRKNLTIKDIINALLGLKSSDYVKGPDVDPKDNESNIWVFGCEFDLVSLYIKLKLYSVDEKDYIKCLSFHD